MKTNQGFSLGEGLLFPSNAESYVSNDYYTFVNDGQHFTDSKLNLGIGIGLRFDKKNSLELVFSADGSSIRQSFSFYNLNSSYSAIEGFSLMWGREFFRMNLEYNRTILTKQSFDLRSMVGLGCFIMHKRTEVMESHFGNHLFSADLTMTNLNTNSLSPIAQFGFGLDFKTKRNVPILSVDIFATLNFLNFFSPMNRFRVNTQVVRSIVSVHDYSDNSYYSFSHTLASRGSGINVQISRPIQFYPWRPHKKSVL